MVEWGALVLVGLGAAVVAAFGWQAWWYARERERLDVYHVEDAPPGPRRDRGE